MIEANSIPSSEAFGNHIVFIVAIVDMGSDISVPLLEPIFPDFVSGDDLSITDGTADIECGCTPLPLILKMKHNLNDASIFEDFLFRNNFTFPEEIDLKFIADGNTWRANFHFAGQGDLGCQERWNLIFDWCCTSPDDSILIDAGLIWKFCILIQRTCVDTSEDFDTRLLYTFDIDSICPSSPDLLVELLIDTQMDGVITTNTESIISDSIFFDDIGLFKNKFWIKNPDLKITISEVDIEPSDPQFDIKPIFNEDPLILKENSSIFTPVG